MIYRDWLVAFYEPPAERRRWWHIWHAHRPGFGHCLALGWDEVREAWLVLDWTHEGLSIAHMPDEDLGTFAAGLTHPDSRGRILRLPADWPGDGSDPFIFPGFAYCVTMVKHLIGLRDLSVTPYQLFCALRRRGAYEIFQATRNAWKEADGVRKQGDLDDQPPEGGDRLGQRLGARQAAGGEPFFSICASL